MQITIIHDTWAKQDVVPASQLKGDLKSFVKTGTVLEASKNELAPSNHRRITLETKLNGYNTWLFFADHLEYEVKDFSISEAQVAVVFGRSISAAQFKDLLSCLKQFQINTRQRVCHFLAQGAHESFGLIYTKEGDLGWYIPRNFGLPAIAASDGAYKYRGAGMGQLTMPENYRLFSEFMNDSRIYDLGCPYVAEVYPITSFGWWWHENGLNKMIDQGASVEAVSRMVNLGGSPGEINGLADRQRYYQKALEAI